MGRFITGDFQYKFAFGEQGSTFGEVLEKILAETESYVNRYIGTQYQGEQIELDITNQEEVINAIKTYIGEDFKVKTDEELKIPENREQYWDKLMMYLFLKRCKDKLTADETLHFYVEY